MSSKLEKEGMYFSDPCITNVCPAGIAGICVLPDGTYLDCIRSGNAIGNYPQILREVVNWDNIRNGVFRKPFETCCKGLEYE